MDYTSTENRPQEPRKEKHLAWVGMTTGALIGAVLIGFIFFLPSLFTNFPYQRVLVTAGAVFGAIQGAYLGPLIMLRLSQWYGQRSATS